MFKRLLATLLALFSAAAFAAVEANDATQAQLESLKGVGVTVGERILEARQAGRFQDWSDFLARVKGVGEVTAARLSKAGLTVNGAPYSPRPQAAEK
jgi:competence protein ComEA